VGVERNVGTMSIDALKDILQRHWGFKDFLPLQDEAAQSVLEGRDSVVVLPTGGGKSLCFQAPSMVMEGLAVVVSPLISLMKDQVDSLKESGVTAGCVNSSMSAAERRAVHELIIARKLKLLYVAPERLLADRFIDYLKRARVSFFAVDEAHCISSWGHDFRPEYRGLSALKKEFPKTAVHAYTATATEQVRADIAAQLKLSDPVFHVGSFDRPNLMYRMVRRTDEIGQVCEVLERHRNESGIIYCIRRKDVDFLAERLVEKGYSVRPYHAGLPDEERKRNQEAFINEDAEIIVATIAFGMGIDKSNVRFVIHAAMPKSLEHYQQESGRAGRDGLEAECVLLFSYEDYRMWEYIIEKSETVAREASIKKLGEIHAFCEGAECRHKAISRYFGQELERANCAACDICLKFLKEVDDPLILAQKILSCVIRLKENFGAHYTAQVLRGSRDKKILNRRHDELSTYGLLSEFDIRTVRGWIEQLISQGCLQRSGEYKTLSLTDEGRQVIRGRETPHLLEPVKKKERKRIRSGFDLDSWEGVDRDLFERLRELRLKISKDKGVPPYVVFSDASLRDIARRKPVTREGFLTVHGVGQTKSAQYGEAFMGIVREVCG